MGTHAERVAISDHVSRADQDAFALASHQKAIAAIDAGRFDAEMAPVTVRDAKGRETVVTDGRGPAPRLDASRRWPGSSRPSRCPTARTAATRRSGTVTAGNAPGITDGAAATVVASERAVERLGLTPLARIVGYAQAEVAPKWLFLAPVEGVRRLLDRIELPIEAFDLIEINEAFAAQTLADGRELGFDWDKVNVNGGAIALGHPIGASGARIVATLLHELRAPRRPLWPRDAVPGRRRAPWRRRSSASGSAERLGRRTRRLARGHRSTLAAMTETAVETPTFRHFIAGEWCDSTSGATFESRNPADTRDVIGRFQQGTAADVAMAVQGGRDGRSRCGDGRRPPSAARSCTPSAALMAEHKERLARAMTREMGKVLAEARGDVQEGIDIAYLMAGEGRRMAGDTVPSELPDKWAMSIRQPIGVAGIITPWNFPMAIPCWKIDARAGHRQHGRVQAGERHAPLRDAARRADGRGRLPAGRRQPRHRRRRRGRRRDRREPGRVGHLVHRLVGDRQGRSRSTAGRAAQAAVARARRQERRRRPRRRRPRPRHGRDPVVGVRHDRAALHGRSRVIVERAGRRAAPRAARVAGPQAPARLRARRGRRRRAAHQRAARVDKVGSYVDIGRGEGELVLGGGRATGGDLAHGHFFEPTIFAGVGPMDRIGQEEIFGPVLSVIPVDDYGAAMLALNQTRYGLSSSIFTRDVNTAFRAMRDFETGIVYVNAGTTGAETHLPFGGWKETGNGHREAGHVALDTYTEWKSIYVDFSRPAPARPDRQPAQLRRLAGLTAVLSRTR